MVEYAASKGAYYTSRDAEEKLVKMIADKNGVAPEQVVVTTGSGERLWLYYAHGGTMSAGWFCQGSFC